MENAKLILFEDESMGLEFNSNLFNLSQIMKKKICIFDKKTCTFSVKTFNFSYKADENPNNIIIEIVCEDQKLKAKIEICELVEALDTARLNGEYPPNSYKLRNIIFRLVYEFMKKNIPNGIMINDFMRKSNVLIYNGENILAGIKEFSETEAEFMNISVIDDSFEFGSAVTAGEFIALDFYGYKNKTYKDEVFPVFDFKFEEIFTRKDFTDKFTFVIYNREEDTMILIEAKNYDNIGILKITDKKVMNDFYNVRDSIKENYNNPEKIIENIVNDKNISSDMSFLFSIE